MAILHFAAQSGDGALRQVGAGTGEAGDVDTAFSGVSVGRLEVLNGGTWGTVCILGFDIHEADVACLQLGYLYASTFGTVEDYGYVFK